MLILFFFSFEVLARGGGHLNNVAPKNQDDWKESNFVAHYCQGEVEHRLPDKTRIDCLTDSHAIEYDFASKWKSGLGQTLHYSTMTGKKAGLVLIYKKDTDYRYKQALDSAIKHHKLEVDVWTIQPE